MAIVQDLSSTFFAQEVLHGERALGDARARLAALWDKLVEMSAERDKARDEALCIYHTVDHQRLRLFRTKI